MLNRVVMHEDTFDWTLAAHRYIPHLENQGIHRKQFVPSISESAKIHPSAVVGADCFIGADCDIGPFCLIANGSFLQEKCKLGFGVELHAVVLLREVKIAHSSCVSHSIVGPKANLGFGFVTATRHLKGRPIRVAIGRKTQFFSPVKHHGAVIGSGVQAAVHSSTMPGATVPPNQIIGPHDFFRAE